MVFREGTSTGVNKPSSQDGRRMLERNCSKAFAVDILRAIGRGIPDEIIILPELRL